MTMEILLLDSPDPQNETNKLSPLQALLLLFSYPYCNLVSQFFLRTREYKAGHIFVDRGLELLEQYNDEIPYENAQRIERDLVFLRLALYDALNLWQEYLDYFEDVFVNKRTGAYIGEYIVDPNSSPPPQVRFGRYLIRPLEENLLPPGTSTESLATMGNIHEVTLSQARKRHCYVHALYHCEDRRAIIERKLLRMKAGKSIEHLKRHQKEQLSSEEQQKRFAEMERLFEWMKKR